MDASTILSGVRLVPVVVINDLDRAEPLARALFDVGIKAIEVTLRTDVALAAIDVIARAVPEMIVGAGSVRRSEHFDSIKSAGARFAVSPGSSVALLSAAARTHLPFVPGAATASEMIMLLEQGYVLQKFFPAELQGGLNKIKALAAPLPEVRFFPTGGINGVLAAEYLKFKAVQCVGGSWFIAADDLHRGDFERIAQLAREAVELTRDQGDRGAG